MFEHVASVLQDVRLSDNDAKAVCDKIVIDDAALELIRYLPCLIEQKLLGTACKHPMKKVFVESKEKPLVHPIVHEIR